MKHINNATWEKLQRRKRMMLYFNTTIDAMKQIRCLLLFSKRFTGRLFVCKTTSWAKVNAKELQRLVHSLITGKWIGFFWIIAVFLATTLPQYWMGFSKWRISSLLFTSTMSWIHFRFKRCKAFSAVKFHTTYPDCTSSTARFTLPRSRSFSSWCKTSAALRTSHWLMCITVKIRLPSFASMSKRILD